MAPKRKAPAAEAEAEPEKAPPVKKGKAAAAAKEYKKPAAAPAAKPAKAAKAAKAEPKAEESKKEAPKKEAAATAGAPSIVIEASKVGRRVHAGDGWRRLSCVPRMGVVEEAECVTGTCKLSGSRAAAGGSTRM